MAAPISLSETIQCFDFDRDKRRKCIGKAGYQAVAVKVKKALNARVHLIAEGRVAATLALRSPSRVISLAGVYGLREPENPGSHPPSPLNPPKPNQPVGTSATRYLATTTAAAITTTSPTTATPSKVPYLAVYMTEAN